MTQISAKFFADLIQNSDEPSDQQWREQLLAEWLKECSNRAALIESLIIQRDWASCHRWIDLWETEDSADSLSHSSAVLLPTTNQIND